MILESFKSKAYSAHYWNSFSPDKRAMQVINDYSEQLDEDIKELKDKEISEETINSYVERYKSLFNAWLSAKGRTANWAVTGPANFNVRKQEKASRSEDNHYKVWQEWRARAKKAIVRKEKEPKTFLSELQRYQIELEALKARHEKAKEGNKRIARARKTGEDLTEYLKTEFGIQDHMIEWTLKFGFGLANSNANIKRLEDRIKLMESKEEKANNIGENIKEFEGFKVIFNYEADRLQIKHDTKPDNETIYKLKKNGFKWSPSNQCWQRQLTNNAIWATKHYLGINI